MNPAYQDLTEILRSVTYMCFCTVQGLSQAGVLMSVSRGRQMLVDANALPPVRGFVVLIIRMQPFAAAAHDWRSASRDAQPARRGRAT